MGYLPVISGLECRRALERLGYYFDRQNGSHMIMKLGGSSISVPNHDPIAAGTLRAIIRQSGLTVDEFKNLL